MNILFLTIAYPLAGERNIYVDLIREFHRRGHSLYVACSEQRRNRQPTEMRVEGGINVLRIRTGNLTGQVSLFEKVVTTLMLDMFFLNAIKRKFKNIQFDLIMYSTPPITLGRVISYLKNKDAAKTYLLLKDIFPQNAVDLSMMTTGSLTHRYFRDKESKLYELSDMIGCMSRANVTYILEHNPSISPNKVGVCPNSIMPTTVEYKNKHIVRNKLGIPLNSRVFFYGGNLGKPQGIDFMLSCIQPHINRSDRFFVICGSGTEYQKIVRFYEEHKPQNVLLIDWLSKEEYDQLLAACDVGLIFLDKHFTIPNFPSRLLSYMDKAIPVLACTDRSSDVGKVICQGEFGWWCESTSVDEFGHLIDLICSLSEYRLINLGKNARKYLEAHYTVEESYRIIMKDLDGLGDIRRV